MSGFGIRDKDPGSATKIECLIIVTWIWPPSGEGLGTGEGLPLPGGEDLPGAPATPGEEPRSPAVQQTGQPPSLTRHLSSALAYLVLVLNSNITLYSTALIL